MTDLDRLIRSIRITAGYDDPVLMSAKQVFALTSEVLRLRGDEERLRAVEADAARGRVKAELWSSYEAFVAANGAGSITELVIQRAEARAEMDAVHSYLSLSGVDATDHYRHVGVRDSLLPRVRQVVSDRDALRADVEAAAGELRVPLPTPGTTEARLLLATVAMRRERDEARTAAATERAAVVAWLRACEDESCVFADDIASQFAAEIERGEHRREGDE